MKRQKHWKPWVDEARTSLAILFVMVFMFSVGMFGEHAWKTCVTLYGNTYSVIVVISLFIWAGAIVYILTPKNRQL